jgi:hypothetical protein
VAFHSRGSRRNLETTYFERLLIRSENPLSLVMFGQGRQSRPHHDHVTTHAHPHVLPARPHSRRAT